MRASRRKYKKECEKMAHKHVWHRGDVKESRCFEEGAKWYLGKRFILREVEWDCDCGAYKKSKNKKYEKVSR